MWGRLVTCGTIGNRPNSAPISNRRAGCHPAPQGRLVRMLFEEGVSEISGAAVQKRAVTDLRVLNEAYEYDRPSSFSRGMRIDLNGLAVLLISGTASIDENGETVHVGDFRAQCRRMFYNITGLLDRKSTRLNSSHLGIS